MVVLLHLHGGDPGGASSFGHRKETTATRLDSQSPKARRPRTKKKASSTTTRKTSAKKSKSAEPPRKIHAPGPLAGNREEGQGTMSSSKTRTWVDEELMTMPITTTTI